MLTPTWGSRRAKNSQQFLVCHQLNISQCRFTETQESMLVYNPHSTKTYHHVCLPANSLHYSIRDFNDEEVEYQLVPLPAAVINLPGRSSSALQELCFEAESVPPLGYTAFYVAPLQERLPENEFAKKMKSKPEPEQEVTPTIYNEFLRVTVNKETGLLDSISHAEGAKIDLSQNFYYYSQTVQSHQSGAYSFRPDKNRPTPVAARVTYQTIKGLLVKEIRQQFSDWITQVIRLYRGEEFVEFEWIIGPVPIGTDLGKEVVTIFNTNVTGGGQFYSDSSGRHMLRRTCWNESTGQQQKKPVAACYYLVTSRICIQSQNTSIAMCVLTDRPQGGTSYDEGEIELMLHRRLLTDDGFGLEEPLNEEAFGVGLVVKGKHRLVFGNFKQEIDELSFSERVAAAARRWRHEPWVFMTTGEKVSRRRWQNVRNKRYSMLRLRGLPRHVHVLSLEPWKGGAVLLRLENTLETANRGPFKSEKPEMPEDLAAKASHTTVHLRQLFLQHKIRAVRETTLAANQWLEDARQMDWSTRYVYNGADDDILAEDNAEYRDETKVTKEESRDAGEYRNSIQNTEGNVWAKPAKFFVNLQPDNTSSEELTSDENFSSNLKKRSSKKRGEVAQKTREPALRATGTPLATEAEAEGVEVAGEGPEAAGDGDEEGPARQKRAARDDPPYPPPDTSPEDQPRDDPAEPEYIITLRPTQIRTFVVWFEPAVSPYVM